jgi:two-component system chemotaxis sensor kinase CheA
VLLACRDHIGALIDAVAAGQTEGDAELQAQGEPLLAQLRGFLDAAKPAPSGAGPAKSRSVPVPTPNAVSASDSGRATPTTGTSAAPRPRRAAQRHGPAELHPLPADHGRIVNMVTVTDALPTPAHGPRAVLPGLRDGLPHQADKQAIENVFEFVRDDSRADHPAAAQPLLPTTRS